MTIPRSNALKSIQRAISVTNQSVCLQKKRNQQQVKIIKHRIQTVKAIKAVPQIQQVIQVNNKMFTFEVDIGAGDNDNFCAEETWKELGKPRLSPTTSGYEVANGHPLPALGVFSIPVVLQDSTSSSMPLTFTVTKVPRLNLLGRDAIIKLGINVSALMGLPVNIKQNICPVRPISQELKPDAALQEACTRQLCQEFPDLFKAELGCL